MSNMTQLAIEMRTALQYFASGLDPETQLDMILEIPSVYPAYTVGKNYKTKDVISYGVNSLGDPQLYQVLQDHTSAAEWKPDTAVSLYKAIGTTESGHPLWALPTLTTPATSSATTTSFTFPPSTAMCGRLTPIRQAGKSTLSKHGGTA